MKISIELDDFHDEEYGSIKDYINYQIESEIKKALNIDLTGAIQNKIDEAVKNLIDEKTGELFKEQIDAFGMKFLDDYMEKKIVTTSNYGETVFEGTIKEVVHQSFDKFFEAKVDKHGELSEGHYNSGEKYTRAEYITVNILNNKFAKFAKETVEQTKQAIEKKLTEELKTAVGKSVVEQMGIPKLLESIKSGVQKGTE